MSNLEPNCSLVTTLEDRERVLQLVAKVYKQAGYFNIEGVPASWRETLSLPTTDAFKVEINGQIVGSVCLLYDTGNLPMDGAFPKELGELRRKGQIVEVSKFAVDKDLLKSLLGDSASENQTLVLTQKVSLLLLAQIQMANILKSFRFFCIAVLEKHVNFYKHLKFEEIGKPRGYSTSPDIPETIEYPMALDMVELRQTAKANDGYINSFYTKLFRIMPELKAWYDKN